MAVEVLSGKVFLLITGASQGIGRQIAVTFSELLEPGSKLLLLALDEEGLKGTADKVSKHVSVDLKAVDLSVATADQLSEIIKKSVNPAQFDRIVITHNVASMGDLSKLTTEMADFEYWRKYYDLNVFSPAVLNSVVMKLFKDNGKCKKVVINMTSHAGILPVKCSGYYCSGKAAREMYFKVFAEEYPEVNVLNYSPGSVKTELFDTFRDTVADPGEQKKIHEMISNNQVLTTEQTVNRLVDILKNQLYKSGAHVDYHDKLSTV
ncbi:sepiapterin reductase [Diachasma alloeum]|uniref:sepiapterin reductase n=1 Tax=Diachasma alloeum TaxID=454923 RepID=UPI00073819FB|nr:sepiapterin reductase [Diachasma alloeum]